MSNDDEKTRAGLFRELFAEQLKIVAVEVQIGPLYGSSERR